MSNPLDRPRASKQTSGCEVPVPAQETGGLSRHDLLAAEPMLEFAGFHAGLCHALLAELLEYVARSSLLYWHLRLIKCAKRPPHFLAGKARDWQISSSGPVRAARY
jgi:hypothetical protein